jgi:hypothetical protein
MATTTNPLDAQQISKRLERIARTIAPFLAIAFVMTEQLIKLTYELGFQLGTAIYARSEQLAALWVRVLVPAEVLATPAQQPIPALQLDQLTRRQLQALTGCRRNLSKRQLLAMAMA